MTPEEKARDKQIKKQRAKGAGVKQPSVPFLWTVTFAVVSTLAGFGLGNIFGRIQPRVEIRDRLYIDSVQLDSSITGESGWFQIRYFDGAAVRPVQVRGLEARDRIIRYLGGLP